MTSNDSVEALAAEVRAFAAAREWEQFHLPRSLVLALVGEVGELAAEVQWIPDAAIDQYLAPGSGSDRSAFEEELADVLIYALRLADVVGIDLATAVRQKLRLNAERYPEQLSRGNTSRRDQPPRDDR